MALTQAMIDASKAKGFRELQKLAKQYGIKASGQGVTAAWLHEQLTASVGAPETSKTATTSSSKSVTKASEAAGEVDSKADKPAKKPAAPAAKPATSDTTASASSEEGMAVKDKRLKPSDRSLAKPMRASEVSSTTEMYGGVTPGSGLKPYLYKVKKISFVKDDIETHRYDWVQSENCPQYKARQGPAKQGCKIGDTRTHPTTGEAQVVDVKSNGTLYWTTLAAIAKREAKEAADARKAEARAEARAKAVASAA